MSIAPLVSCIMPTANRRRFVPLAIDYLLRQQYAECELVIVDDGSDAVEDLVPADPRIRYIRTAAGMSLGAKRNFACEQSRGTVIAHIRDDDQPSQHLFHVATARPASTVDGMRRKHPHDARCKTMYVLDQYVTDDAVNHVFPQVAGMGDTYQWDAPESIRHLQMFAPAPIKPNLSAFHLDPSTIVTDVLSETLMQAPGLLVSNRLCAELGHFALQPHVWYEAGVEFRRRRLRYHWLHFTAPLESKIDFARSTFVLRDDARTERITTFASDADLLHTCQNLASHHAAQLRVQEVTFIPGVALLDLFALRLTGLTYFLSDQLVTRLREGEYSGFRIVLTDAVFRAAARSHA